MSASLLSYFYFTALLSIMIDLSLSAALKGSTVGAGDYISQSMHIGALFSQFTAISAAFILMVAGLRVCSTHYRDWRILIASFLSLMVLFLLFIAMQGRLMVSLVLPMATATGLGVLLLSRAKTLTNARGYLTLISVTILLHGCIFYSWPEALSELLQNLFSTLLQGFRWLILISLLVITYVRSRMLVVLSLSLGLLLAQSSMAALHADAPLAVVIIGRGIRELSSNDSSSLLVLLPVCSAFCLALLQLFYSLKNSQRLLSLAALASLLPLSPLALALTLAVGWSLVALDAFNAPQSQSRSDDN